MWSMEEYAHCMMFLPGNTWLASGGFTGVCLWDTTNGELVAGPFGRSVNGFSSSRDGTRLACGSDDGKVYVWDISSRTPNQVAILEAHSSWVWSVSVFPDGKQLASGSEDGTIRVWNICDASQPNRSPLADNFIVGEDGWVRQKQTQALDNGITRESDYPKGYDVGQADKIIQRVDGDRSNSASEAGDSDKADSNNSAEDTRPLFFWIPGIHQTGLYTSTTAYVIGAASIALDYTNFVHGESWTQCYTPQPE